MTNEPVAYWHIPQIKNEEIFVSFNPSKTSHFEDIPLYTSEDLHSRVKMTQAEFNEWVELFSIAYQGKLGIITLLELIGDSHSGKNKYVNLAKRIYDDTYFVFVANKQKELVELLTEYNPDNPEETIEIVPTMKWFVRSKEQYKPDMDQGISESGYLYLMQGNFYKVDYYLPTPFKDDAQQFDTKEEAEKWENPLTEAVLLPVEDE